MSRRSRATALLLATAALAFGALVGIGCGDDEEEVTLPTISVEETTGTTVPTETTGTATTPTEPQTGGTGSGNFDPSQEDSATNDKPPKPGSPEAAFEEACKQNPEACG